MGWLKLGDLPDIVVTFIWITAVGSVGFAVYYGFFNKLVPERV